MTDRITLSNRRVLDISFFLLALVSLTYAVATAPRGGSDLRFFWECGQSWLDGTYKIGSGPGRLYPPFSAPMFAPLALVPFDYLVIIWLAFNIALTFLTLHLAIRLYGAEWMLRPAFYLSAMLLTWAGFRVTLRLGHISLLMTALVLGALLASRRNRKVLAGVLMGLSLCKYSLTLPFLLYFIFRKEWKVAAVALMVPLVFAEVFALRMGTTVVDSCRTYASVMFEGQVAGGTGWMGTAGNTEIRPLLMSVTGGNETLTLALTVTLGLAGLIAMAVVFRRTPECEKAQFAVLALFALWSAYHRVYDSVICILPAALLIDFVVRKKLVGFSRFWLGGLGLLTLSLPGLLTERLHLDAAELSGNPAGWLGLHIERLLVFGLFWSLLFVMWREARSHRASVHGVPLSPGTTSADL
ncbi:MAG TPA: glycosyltransferase family 87 protein [Blastocatellia bacterium]|nr:glycosyltransferase family 87 protein [Blastocatellia bacterium]